MTEKKFTEIFESCPTSVRLTFARQEDSDKPDPVLGDHGVMIPKKVVAVFSFSQKGFGFGELCFVCDEDGQMYIDTESMSHDKVKELLGIMVDNAITDNETDPEKHRQYHRARGGWCARCPPDNLDEAIEFLKRIMDEETEELFKKVDVEEVVARLHHTMGRWMRNEWGLWQSGPLKQQLEELGLEHPDDMSSVVLNRLWCEVNEKPFDLLAVIQHYTSPS